VLRTSPTAPPVPHRWFTIGELYDFCVGPEANRHHTRLTKNGLLRELRRQRFMQVNNGQPIKTFAGAQRLWCVRNTKELANYSIAQVAKGYAEDRQQNAKALAGVKEAMGVAKYK